jgi:hypothetical protein
LLYSYEAIGRNPEKYAKQIVGKVLPESMVEQGSEK